MFYRCGLFSCTLLLRTIVVDGSHLTLENTTHVLVGTFNSAHTSSGITHLAYFILLYWKTAESTRAYKYHSLRMCVCVCVAQALHCRKVQSSLFSEDKPRVRGGGSMVGYTGFNEDVAR